MMPKKFLLGIVLLAAGLTACAPSSTLYIRPDADLHVIKTVAVLPFESNAQDRNAGDKVQKIFTAELLSNGVYEVIEPGIVLRVLRDERIDAVSTMNAADIKRVGEALGVQALIAGTVMDFEENRLGSTPVPRVTIQLRLIETRSGATVWSVTATRSGAGVLTRLFGYGAETPVEAAQTLLRKEIRTLFEK